MGSPNFEMLRKDNLPVRAFLTTASSKPPLIQHLALALEQETVMLLNHPWATAELEAYTSKINPITNRVTYGPSAEKSGENGIHDDSVMGRALALYSCAGRNVIRFS